MKHTILFFPFFLDANALSPKPTLIGGGLISLLFGYGIARIIRGRNFMKQTNSTKHKSDVALLVTISLIIFFLWISNIH